MSRNDPAQRPPAPGLDLTTTAEAAAREIIGPDFIATGVIPDSLLSGRALALFGPAGPGDGTALTQTSLATVVRGMPGLTIAQTGRRGEYEILDEPREAD